MIRRIAWSIWLGLALLALPTFGTVAEAATRPNIVIILADDVGFSDIGCYGGEIHTPNLDALAADGLRFTQFYNTSRCCPSRACLLTGLYPHQAGIGHMTDAWSPVLNDGYVRDLNEHCVAIAQVMRSAGYGTYAVGKWHVTQEIAPDAADKHNWPLHRGFDRYCGTIMGAGSFFDPAMLCRGDTAISPFADPEYHAPAGQPYYCTDAIGDQACRFIREHDRGQAGRPFFMYVAFTAAHWPMQALPRPHRDARPRHRAARPHPANGPAMGGVGPPLPRVALAVEAAIRRPQDVARISRHRKQAVSAGSRRCSGGSRRDTEHSRGRPAAPESMRLHVACAHMARRNN